MCTYVCVAVSKGLNSWYNWRRDWIRLLIALLDFFVMYLWNAIFIKL